MDVEGVVSGFYQRKGKVVLSDRIPDLELPTAHPKRAFMRRVVDLEVRLAYHDRILQSLPEQMLEEVAGVVSKDAPDPTWVYEQAGQLYSLLPRSQLTIRPSSACRSCRATQAISI